MYFWTVPFEDTRWGIQGDAQLRAREAGSDLGQVLVRGGLTFTPSGGPGTFTLGIASVTSGEFGDGGDTFHESRIYQEAVLPQRLGERVFLRHRARLEERLVENQDFRGRIRYALLGDLPLNGPRVAGGVVYLAAYNEVFLNLNQDIGNGQTVDTFDRNRLFGAVGYGVTSRIRVQGGYMHQWTSGVDAGQLQMSLHHTW